MKRYGRPEIIVLPGFAPMAPLYARSARRICKTPLHLSNRAENSHLPFRRRERAMPRFRRMQSLQKFVAVHASVSNHFNLDRSLSKRQHFKMNRAAALEEWCQLAAA